MELEERPSRSDATEPADEREGTFDELRGAVERAALDIVLDSGWDDDRIERLDGELAVILRAAERLGRERIGRRADEIRQTLNRAADDSDDAPLPNHELRIQAGIVSLQRMLAAADRPSPGDSAEESDEAQRPQVGAGAASNTDTGTTVRATPEPDPASPEAGAGDAGSDDAGSGDAGSDDAGSDDAGSGDPGSSDPDCIEVETEIEDCSLAADPESLQDFIHEAREHFGAIDEEVLALEESREDEELVNSLFRRFHTIKGLAGFLDFEAISRVAHAVENVLGAIRDGELSVDPDVIDAILEGVDYLRESVDAVERSLHDDARPGFRDHQALEQTLRRLLEPGPQRAVEGRADEDEPSVQKASGAASAPDPASPAPPRPARHSARRFEALRVNTAKLDYLVEMAGELVIAQTMVRHDRALQGAVDPELAGKLTQLSRLTQDIQTTAMELRLVPVAQLFDRAARLVRDISRKLGKKVRLERSGADVEVDKGVVEKLVDPLLHLVRNAVDHGIEPPDQRKAAGKSEEAVVAVRARHDAGRIVIEIADDGRGLDAQKIIAKARERALLPDSYEPTPQQAYELIFEPGFSTNERVTATSGRGVGMDVVKRNIIALRGRVEVESEPGRGAVLRMTIPLTLALIDGLVVGVGAERYVVPLFAVQEMLRPSAEMIRTLEGRTEMALVRGALLPIVRLSRRFGVEAAADALENSLLLVVTSGPRRFCLAVDSFLGKQEVVIKTLGRYLDGTPGVSGAAILGDGRVGLILDVGSLYRRAAHG